MTLEYHAVLRNLPVSTCLCRATIDKYHEEEKTAFGLYFALDNSLARSLLNFLKHGTVCLPYQFC